MYTIYSPVNLDIWWYKNSHPVENWQDCSKHHHEWNLRSPHRSDNWKTIYSGSKITKYTLVYVVKNVIFIMQKMLKIKI